MSRRPNMYKRLAGGRIGAMFRHSLWIADDHLLSVRSTGFSERYRRYYFRDIQALALQQRRSTGMTISDWAILTAAVCIPTVLLAMGHGALAVLLFLILLPVALFRLMRRTCNVWIQTAVSVEQLPALRRARPAIKALAIIEQKIMESQSANRQHEASTPETPQSTPVSGPEFR